ncbi:hypothetical protein HP397_05490 [Streptobacillus felis]|uniref:Uncharacterized protein n=1 Tax=Streptobacillus felis TaxID=1384509 RepID=A0A7Z0PFD6_9FUSO|nr:hypothetical protein [Streptobacillus felis]NYV28258.1 hypothetical protein [Streptobacillus felis]
MLKFLKYEFKRNWRFNILVSITLLILVIISNLLYNTPENDYIFFKILTALSTSVTSFSIMYYYIKNFSKDLYSDTGYLTFSLPISGYTYFWGKVIFYLLFSIALLPMTILTAIMQGQFDDIILLIKKFPSLFTNERLLLGIILLILIIVYVTVILYTSITLIHYLSKSKNTYFLWVLIFVSIMVLSFYALFKINILIYPFNDAEPSISVLLLNVFILSFYNLVFGTLAGYLIDKKLELQ